MRRTLSFLFIFTFAIVITEFLAPDNLSIGMKTYASNPKNGKIKYKKISKAESLIIEKEFKDHLRYNKPQKYQRTKIEIYEYSIIDDTIKQAITNYIDTLNVTKKNGFLTLVPHNDGVEMLFTLHNIVDSFETDDLSKVLGFIDLKGKIVYVYWYFKDECPDWLKRDKKHKMVYEILVTDGLSNGFGSDGIMRYPVYVYPSERERYKRIQEDGGRWILNKIDLKDD